MGHYLITIKIKVGFLIRNSLLLKIKKHNIPKLILPGKKNAIRLSQIFMMIQMINK